MCFIAKYYSGKPDGKVIPVTAPAGTITCADGQALVHPKFIVQRNGGEPDSRVISVDGPARTLTSTAGNQEVVQCFLHSYYGNGDNNRSVDEPCATLRTKDTVIKIWLDKSYSGKHNHQSIEVPAGVVLSKDKYATIQVSSWLDRNFSSGGQHSSIDDPAGSVLSIPKLNLVQAEPFIMNTSYGNAGTGINQPSPPLLASRRHHYIVNPGFGGHSHSVDVPCPVIIARQDKKPLYLIDVEHADVLIPVYDDEPEIMVLIKEFMALYGISDIKMRMLKVLELLKIQGFPIGYHLYGNQSDQKKFIGNSVVPLVVKAWCEAMGLKLLEERVAV